jgi:tripartite ATP-independent transporter DctP family solute receptor
MTTYRISRRQVLAASATVGLAACGDYTPGSRLLRGADAQPDGYPTVEAVKEFGRLLKERTGGRLALKLYSGGQMGEERDTLELTLLGGIDLNRISMASLATIAPETHVPGLPFLFRSAAHMRAAMDGAPGRKILNALAAHGLVGLCFYDAGERSFYTKSREIRTPDDMRGLKIRVQNSDVFVSLMSALGANATPMPYGEVYQALLQGVVDGAENNWPSYESSRHFEAAPIYSLTRHVMLPEVLVMSSRRWNKLAPHDQSLVQQAAADSVPYMRALWDARERASEALLRAADVTIIEDVDTAAFQERVQPVWDRFLVTPALRQLAEDVVNTGDAHG